MFFFQGFGIAKYITTPIMTSIIIIIKDNSKYFLHNYALASLLVSLAISSCSLALYAISVAFGSN